MQIPDALNGLQLDEAQESADLLVTLRCNLRRRSFCTAFCGWGIEINHQRLIAGNAKLQIAAHGIAHRGRSIQHAL